MLDSGYSFSHVVPYVKGRRVKEGIRRINVGGKKLTNYLKDVISFRQLNVMDETYVINQVINPVLWRRVCENPLRVLLVNNVLRM